ncbi:MAG: YbaN family protein [Clostridium sp.]
MKFLFVFIGLISLFLGFIGIAIPVLPTTPFLLLSSFCFLKSSKKLHTWLTNGDLYKKYAKDLVETKSLTLKRKITILLFADVLIIISMLIIRNLYINLFLLLIILFKLWYFTFKIKTISVKETVSNQ